MKLGYARGNHLNQQLDLLEEQGVDELFSDAEIEYDTLNDPSSDFQALLTYAQPGDKLIISSPEVISRDYQQLIAFLNQLEKSGLLLSIVSLPHLTMSEWRDFFSWSLRNERLLHPRLFRLKQEKSRNRNGYSLFSTNPEAKKMYREIIWLLIEKKPVRAIANRKRVPMETVYRIKQELAQIQLAAILIVCFFLAIFSIKITQMYFDNLWLQILICIVISLVILYNVLVDSRE